MDVTNQNIIIRETEINNKKYILEEREKKFYEEFNFDFDVNEDLTLE